MADNAYKHRNPLSLRRRKALRQSFFAQLGPSAESLRQLFEFVSPVGFYMKDREGRIMALNRRNCENCNFKSEWDVIGLKSSDLFPATYAADFMAADAEVLQTGKPLLDSVSEYTVDRSLTVFRRNVYPLFSTSGEIVGTACVYSMMTERTNKESRYGRIRAAAEHVNAHYTEPIQLEDLMAQAKMAKTTFKETFFEVFGLTPGHYITTIRLNAARKLLETTDKLVADIATETGFYDQSHLTRAFKRERGMTPGEYRRRHQSVSTPGSRSSRRCTAPSRAH